MKAKKKGLVIGNSNFKEIIIRNGYYIDKTKFKNIIRFIRS